MAMFWLVFVLFSRDIYGATLAEFITETDFGNNTDGWTFTETPYTGCSINNNGGQTTQCGIVEIPGGSVNPGVIIAPAHGGSGIGNRCQSPIRDLTDDSICWGIGRDATATLNVSTVGWENVNITYTIDPWAVTGSQVCLVEYSLDGGATWIEIDTYSSGAQGPVTIELAGAVDNEELVQFRFSGDHITGQNGWCYLKDVILEGTTMAPTLSPTETPTMTPTKSPTQYPTTSPTQYPTTTPTQSPTQYPTTTPTQSPSLSPSISPSKSPSLSPSVSPSRSPTESDEADDGGIDTGTGDDDDDDDDDDMDSGDDDDSSDDDDTLNARATNKDNNGLKYLASQNPVTFGAVTGGILLAIIIIMITLGIFLKTKFASKEPKFSKVDAVINTNEINEANEVNENDEVNELKA